MAGRFKLIFDEHWSKAHIKAAREAGWEVVRVVDVLGQETKDPGIMAFCEEHGCAWVTCDKRAQAQATQWINSGKMLPGVIIGVERRKRITPGRFLRFLEELAAEEAPFAGIIRFVTPEEIVGLGTP